MRHKLHVCARHYPLGIVAALAAFYAVEIAPLPTPGLVACAAIAEQHIAQVIQLVYTYCRATLTRWGV